MKKMMVMTLLSALFLAACGTDSMSAEDTKVTESAVKEKEKAVKDIPFMSMTKDEVYDTLSEYDPIFVEDSSEFAGLYSGVMLTTNSSTKEDSVYIEIKDDGSFTMYKFDEIDSAEGNDQYYYSNDKSEWTKVNDEILLKDNNGILIYEGYLTQQFGEYSFVKVFNQLYFPSLNTDGKYEFTYPRNSYAGSHPEPILHQDMTFTITEKGVSIFGSENDSDTTILIRANKVDGNDEFKNLFNMNELKSAHQVYEEIQIDKSLRVENSNQGDTQTDNPGLYYYGLYELGYVTKSEELPLEDYPTTTDDDRVIEYVWRERGEPRGYADHFVYEYDSSNDSWNLKLTEP